MPYYSPPPPAPPHPHARYTRVCEYCRTDPVKSMCVNCGATQPVRRHVEPSMVEVTTLGDSHRRFIPAMQDESFRN